MNQTTNEAAELLVGGQLDLKTLPSAEALLNPRADPLSGFLPGWCQSQPPQSSSSVSAALARRRCSGETQRRSRPTPLRSRVQKPTAVETHLTLCGARNEPFARKGAYPAAPLIEIP